MNMEKVVALFTDDGDLTQYVRKMGPGSYDIRGCDIEGNTYVHVLDTLRKFNGTEETMIELSRFILEECRDTVFKILMLAAVYDTISDDTIKDRDVANKYESLLEILREDGCCYIHGCYTITCDHYQIVINDFTRHVLRIVTPNITYDSSTSTFFEDLECRCLRYKEWGY